MQSDSALVRRASRSAPSFPIAHAFHGARPDAFVYAEAAFAVIDPDLLRFLPERILVDECGFAKTLLERVTTFDQQGPPPLPEGEDESPQYLQIAVVPADGRDGESGPIAAVGGCRVLPLRSFNFRPKRGMLALRSCSWPRSTFG
jgi:hypothetical protein